MLVFRYYDLSVYEFLYSFASTEKKLKDYRFGKDNKKVADSFQMRSYNSVQFSTTRSIFQASLLFPKLEANEQRDFVYYSRKFAKYYVLCIVCFFSRNRCFVFQGVIVDV